MLSEAELDPLFDAATDEWFRLEARSTYLTAAEEPRLGSYLAGMPYDPATEPAAWLTEIRDRVGGGLTFRKCRVVRSPLTEYERWEFEWSYPATERAGQRTFVLDLAETHDAPSLPSYDWWMLDERVVLRMEYDRTGGFLGADRLPDEAAAAHVRFRDEALGLAVPFPDYWDAHPREWRATWLGADHGVVADRGDS